MEGGVGMVEHSSDYEMAVMPEQLVPQQVGSHSHRIVFNNSCQF